MQEEQQYRRGEEPCDDLFVEDHDFVGFLLLVTDSKYHFKKGTNEQTNEKKRDLLLLTTIQHVLPEKKKFIRLLTTYSILMTNLLLIRSYHCYK